MADDQAAIDANPDLQDSLRLGGLADPVEPDATAPLYRVFAGSKIPVAKSHGALWQSRIKQAAVARSDVELAWQEAVRYYVNDQMSHRKGGNDRHGGMRHTRYLGEGHTATENIVFANSTAMLPMLYAKNPSVEATATNEVNEDFATCAKHLINALFSMKESPGINLKTVVRRGILMTLLTNCAYIKLDWVDKKDSSQAAIDELQKLSTALQNAKNQKEIREVEGQITALTDAVSVLEPAGPTRKLRSPSRVFVDATAQEPDGSDANWMAEWDYLPTSYLNAVFATKGDNDQYKSVYEPTHVLNAGDSINSVEEEVNNFTLFQTDQSFEAKNYGYSTESAYKAAMYTKVWYVWDKTTRRVYMYTDNYWKWPLWVWDDPLKLLRFFPYHRLWFHETPEGSQPKGEVTYYLDQQDEINDINSEIATARSWSRRNLFYDKNSISQADVEQVLKGPDGTARGINLPEGKTLKDVIFSMLPPSLSTPELFNKDQQLQTINRITGINDAQRGAQFKTNTTNQAINFYQQNVDIRVDEKIDAIEDWIGDIAWSLLQLCCAKWTAQDVAAIIGENYAKAWKQVTDPNQLRTMLNIRIVGGSTDKPTSQTKKKQALEIGQVVGQFANAIPAAGMIIMKVLERAFDEVVLSAEDWEMIEQSVQQQQQQQAGQAPPDEPGDGSSGQPSQGNGPDPQQAQQIKNLIAKLPPEAQQKLQELVNQGVSPTDALKQVVQMVDQTQH